MHLNQRRVVVTGIGMITPLALSAEETWSRILRGESGIGPITQFDAANFLTRIAGEVKGFDLSSFLHEPRLAQGQLKRMDRCSQFAVASADMALQDSQLDLSRENPERIGVFIGSGIGGETTRFANQKRLLQSGPSKVSPFTIPGTMPNESSARIAENWGFTGWNLGGLTSACASGSFAIGEGSEIIKRGDADIMVVGGAESPLSPLYVASFIQMRALSKRNEEPEKASRPCDLGRDGFVMAEGAGIVILEELERTIARSAKIYGEIIGYGASCDANPNSITEPEPTGKEVGRAILIAINKAGITPSEIDYINLHGTATPAGDPAEINGVCRVFSSPYPPMSSTKSETGHMIGAAGAVEFIVCLLAIRDQRIPPTINLDNPDPRCTLDGILDLVPKTAKIARVNVALNNSFGFGGHNACLLVRRFES